MFDLAGDKISRGRRSYPRTPLPGPAAVLTLAHVLRIVPKGEREFPLMCRGSPKKGRGRSGLERAPRTNRAAFLDSAPTDTHNKTYPGLGKPRQLMLFLAEIRWTFLEKNGACQKGRMQLGMEKTRYSHWQKVEEDGGLEHIILLSHLLIVSRN
ncbi:uncharacterized protein LOC108024937 [Drosophila biarmipes]|uniref:uncharacterized protein LOC108024937 n=1 Tax=Drosophila biarmipes TaxID=125945 RepID=UPI0007E62F51|nr:uncharacterized protein LOC108024937 [Drosophila biarmipes]XP_050745071.1 uncharacterized protein LOC108024937 [Drosophila biarmipes]